MKSDVFVEREFEIDEANTLTLRVYQPVRAGSGEYKCAYDIRKGRAVLRRFAMNGEDGLQALLLALGAVVTELEVLQREMNGRISAADLRDLRRLRPKPA